MPYSYVFVRSDISKAQQLVQACHACQEAGAKFGCPDNTHLIALHVGNEDELEVIAYDLDSCEAKYVKFFEPDLPGYTAICTCPDQNRAVKKMAKKLPMLQMD